MTAKLTVDESDVRTAHKVVWTVKAASVSILQRHLCLGYLRAGAILDELERRGIVGPADVNGFPRRVLVAPEGCDAGSLPTPDRPAVGTDANDGAASLVRSDALLDILSGADDGDQTADMLRLAAEYLDDSGFGGPLAGKLRAKATRIEDVLSSKGIDRKDGAKR
jgi:hypothetical protein